MKEFVVNNTKKRVGKEKEERIMRDSARLAFFPCMAKLGSSEFQTVLATTERGGYLDSFFLLLIYRIFFYLRLFA